MNKPIMMIAISEQELQEMLLKAMKNCLSHIETREIKSLNRPLSRKEAAHFLGVSLPTLDKYTLSGKIGAVRIGRKKFYTTDSLSNSLVPKNHNKY